MMKLVKLCFSPTGGTKKVLDLVARVWTEDDGQSPEVIEVDLCRAGQDFSTIRLDSGDLCLAAVPSFGGRVPAIAVSRLREIRGNGAPAVLIAVYGNRAYEDTLLELEDVMLAAGFRCFAAIAAVAEHSILRQFAAGRPDEADRRELADFARKIKAAAAVSPERERTAAVPGNSPYKEYKVLPMTPAAGKGCTSCGLCANACPARAIPPERPACTDKEKCISCMRCVAICPQKARKVNKPLLFAAGKKLEKACAGRKPNELFF